MTMHSRPFQKNEIQFAYFTDNYLQFESDFYQYSALHIPLTFLTDDILHSMAEGQTNYFKLNKENARDHRDHYFFFTLQIVKSTPLIRQYLYTGHSLHATAPHTTNAKKKKY